MKLLKTLSLQEFAALLRQYGMPIGTEKLKAAIALGVFSGCVHCIPMLDDEYLILERDVLEWIDAHAVDAQPSSDLMAYLALTSQCQASVPSSSKGGPAHDNL